MKKTLFFAIAVIWITFKANSQDTIYVSEKKLYAKVHEVNRIFVKLHFPGNKSFRRISLSAVDSIKYEDGRLDEFVKNYWLKRNEASEEREAKIAMGRKKRREAYRKYKVKNSFADPMPNRFSTGAQAISTSLFIVKPLFHSADISAALGTHATYERSIFRNRAGVAATGYWSWNKKAQGVMVNTKYYFLNRPKFRIGAGPFFAYSSTYFRTIKNWRYSNYYGSGDVNKDTTVSSLASTIGVNWGIGLNLGKRYFISQDIFAGGTDYKGISTEKGFFSYRLGMGIRF